MAVLHRAGSSPASRTIKLLVNSRAYGVICKPFSFGQVSGFDLVFPAFSGFFQREFGKILGRDYRCVPAFLGVEHVRSVLAAELSSKVRRGKYSLH